MKESVVGDTRGSIRLVNWVKPPEHTLALNVDGCFKKRECMAGYGGVLRDHQGHWVAGFMGRIEAEHVLEVESWAVCKT